MESFFGKFGRVTRTYQDVFGHQMSTRVREGACTAQTAFSHGGAGRNGCARACIGHVQDLFLHALAEVGVESVARLESAVNDDVLRYRARLLSIQTMLERHLERLTGVPVHACCFAHARYCTFPWLILRSVGRAWSCRSRRGPLARFRHRPLPASHNLLLWLQRRRRPCPPRWVWGALRQVGQSGLY